jgi:Golgi phosphoprotein 3 (GPP34)
MTPGLGGTGRVADDLYLLAHNDINGRPFVQPRPLGIGLAGGLLAELALAGAITVGTSHAVAVTGQPPPPDELAAHVLGLLAGEHEPHPARDWLLFLGRTAAASVAGRLARSGYLARSGGRWRPGRWLPVDADSAFAPLLRIRAALDASRPLTAEGAVLAGMAVACGLGFRLAEYTAPRAGRTLGEAVAPLSNGLPQLVAQTRAAVDSTVLTHRR